MKFIILVMISLIMLFGYGKIKVGNNPLNIPYDDPMRIEQADEFNRNFSKLVQCDVLSVNNTRDNKHISANEYAFMLFVARSFCIVKTEGKRPCPAIIKIVDVSPPYHITCEAAKTYDGI